MAGRARSLVPASISERLCLGGTADDDHEHFASDEMRAFVEAQMAQGEYASASEYLRSLIRDAQKRQAKPALEAELLEALQGPAVEMTRDEWDSIEREALEGLAGEMIRP